MEGQRVRIVDVPEAGVYAGRAGRVSGWSSLSGAPDHARTKHGPVIAVHADGSAESDIVYGVWFEETRETAWFPPHLFELLGMDDQTWRFWWTRRGESQLTLLLWAVWNPVGTCPPDEYEDYSLRVAELMREEYEADKPLAAKAAYDTAVQLERNKRWAASVERLAKLLQDVRTGEMEEIAEWRADVEAAQTLLEWHEWEMMEWDPD